MPEKRMVVHELILEMYDCLPSASRRSLPKLNALVRDALELCVKHQMHFEKGEMENIFLDFGGSGDHEWILRLACQSGNASAATSFLAWKDRRRFPWPKDGVNVIGMLGSKLDLLYEERMFRWNGEEVLVTSFNDEKGTVTACSYVDGYRSRVRHRYALTPEDLKAALKTLGVADA